MPHRHPAPFVAIVVLVGSLMGCGDGQEATVPTTTLKTTTIPPTAAAPTTIVLPSTTVSSTTIPPATTLPPAATSAVPATTTSAPATTAAPPTNSTIARPPRTYDFDAVGPIVQAYVDEQGLNGAGLIVVERDDGVVHHQHWGEFGPARVSLIASSSKMLVAGILMYLHDRGLLDVDAAVSEVVPWDGNPAITPMQLVSNTSGLVGLFPDLAYGPYVCQFLPVGTLQACAEQIFTTVEDDADVVPPDTEFRYGGGQWQVAGALAEVASGRSWAELVDEVYVEPCGLDVLAFNNPFTQFDTPPLTYPSAFASDPGTLMATDNPNMEGGAYTTTGAYGELLLMYLRDGRCRDQRVLTAQSVDRILTDRTLVVLGGEDGGVLDYGVGIGYGMGWWVDRETGRRSDGGAYGSMPWLDLDGGFGAYLVLEATSGHGRDLAERLFDAVESAVLAART